MLWPSRKGRPLKILVLGLLVQTALLTSAGRAELRKVKVGDTMPEFSLPDATGATFTYKHGASKVLTLTFLPTVQSRFERAIADIEAVAGVLPETAEGLGFAGVISGSAGKELLKSSGSGSKPGFRILLDGQYHLWGTLGVVAAPTVVIVGKDDRVLWIKAGYGYDFVPVVRAYLNQAMGIAQETAPEQAQHVKAVTNDTVVARLQRHLQMARILEQKGRLESAIAEVQKAIELDPDSIEPPLVLGELFCRSGRNKEALELTGKLKAVRKTHKARLLLLSGWARRQMGELEPAEKLLIEATTLDPESARALFELGKVYQAQSRTGKAMESYRKALTLVFDTSDRVEVSNRGQGSDPVSQK
ncbi:MAG: tetratricopeptide repeat protein [Phycisphaerales bacterium]|nr:MAG: tetratricopeptide repeat protein [Phycisphaerales bacterium]